LLVLAENRFARVRIVPRIFAPFISAVVKYTAIRLVPAREAFQLLVSWRIVSLVPCQPASVQCDRAVLLRGVPAGP
jgi:hypothetical protein